VAIGLALCASKVALEAAMFPAIHWGMFGEQSVVYGIEANVEESVQLFGFAAFFAGFAQLLLDRVVLMARDELETHDATAAERSPADKWPLTREWREAV